MAEAKTNPASPGVDATLYLHPQTLARLGSFELRAKHIVEGVTSGMHRSPYQGFSVEFAQHRPYAAGDDIRRLDWKVYGRSDKLYVKQHQQETNLDLVIMVDGSGSMNFGSRLFEEASGAGRKTSVDGRTNWTKFDHATAVAAAMSYIALRQGDRAGMLVYADQILSIIRQSGAQGQWRQIVSMLATHPVAKPTDLPRAMDQLLAKVTNRCLLVIISDFYTDPQSIRTALARAKHKRHDAILFQIVDKREATFDFGDELPFVGLEGEPRVRLDPRSIRKAYLEAFNNHQAEIKRIARSFGFDFQVVSTHDWLGPPLAAFIARRNAQIKKLKVG